MARIDNEIRITPSVFDRLLDFEPDVSSEAPKSRSKSLRELKQSVKRDLEWLLNTRRYAGEIPDNLEEVNKSVLIFGLPDFTGLGAKSSAEQKRLIKELESALKIFEPRLMDVRVSFEPPSETERVLKFRIEARMRVDPTPEPVTFDTILQLGSGAYMVQEK
ncbi:MAG TPA: type VI secretion system baseplate subunit TssE [Pyrinomonadaceae bacterium]|jgi:type VI secretion system protein ImpF|nr:type VI secretion system baseplate subunit TssE [Pyrinomonadaceae bacterium]